MKKKSRFLFFLLAVSVLTSSCSSFQSSNNDHYVYAVTCIALRGDGYHNDSTNYVSKKEFIKIKNGKEQYACNLSSPYIMPLNGRHKFSPAEINDIERKIEKKDELDNKYINKILLIKNNYFIVYYY
ncbi:MAG: hypothetical protein ACYDAM_06165 [Leptospirales bacterium]